MANRGGYLERGELDHDPLSALCMHQQIQVQADCVGRHSRAISPKEQTSPAMANIEPWSAAGDHHERKPLATNTGRRVSNNGSAADPRPAVIGRGQRRESARHGHADDRHVAPAGPLVHARPQTPLTHNSTRRLRMRPLAVIILFSTKLRQAGFASADGRLSTIDHMQLTEDVLCVITRGFDAQAELRGDLLVASPLSDQR